jgi:hypothetical protein
MPHHSGRVDANCGGWQYAKMTNKELTHDQWEALSEIYGEMQRKTLRIEKRLNLRNPPGTSELYKLNHRMNDLAQQLRMHCHYAGVQSRRVADGRTTPKQDDEASPP